jgi:membrane carboxypeptidase/penicillin-binding protein
MVGGRHFTESAFNRAVECPTPAGIGYSNRSFMHWPSPAGFTQASLVLDAPVVYQRSEKMKTGDRKITRNITRVK